MLKLETAYFSGDVILRFEKIYFLDVIIVGIKPAALCFIVHLHYIDLHFSSCGNSAICSEKKRPLSLYNPIHDVTRQALGQLICRHWDYSWCLINLIAVVCVCVCSAGTSEMQLIGNNAANTCFLCVPRDFDFCCRARVSSFATRSLASHMSYQV